MTPDRLRLMRLLAESPGACMKGTLLVPIGQVTLRELVDSAERYETVRKLNPRQFSELHAYNIRDGIPFDELVDGLER